jgi:hypothetical protein
MFITAIIYKVRAALLNGIEVINKKNLQNLHLIGWFVMKRLRIRIL